MSVPDEKLIRKSLEIARRARENGNHPFGALLADPNGNVLLEAEYLATHSPIRPFAHSLNLNHLRSSP